MVRRRRTNGLKRNQLKRSQLARAVLTKWIWRGAGESESLIACNAVRFGKTKPGRTSNTDNLMNKGRKIMTKHNLQFVTAALALFLGIASVAFGGVPRMEVTVLDPSGKVRSTVRRTRTAPSRPQVFRRGSTWFSSTQRVQLRSVISTCWLFPRAERR